MLFLLTLLSVVAWMMATVSFTMYSIFRYLYLPSAQHIESIHLNFDVMNDRPTTLVRMSEPGSAFLRAGQEYDMSIFLEVLESDVNKDFGMFMIQVELYNDRLEGEKVVQTITFESSRHSILRYQSPLLYVMSTVVFSPWLLAGVTEQKQTLHTFLMEQLTDDGNTPTNSLRVSLSKPVQLYSARLQFDAHFTGLRAFMYWYPILSAVVFNTVMFFFLFSGAVVFLVIAYLQYSNSLNQDHADWREHDYEDSMMQSDPMSSMQGMGGIDTIDTTEALSMDSRSDTLDSTSTEGYGLRQRVYGKTMDD
ncbi:hypothetical protein SARC_11188 [Sphaeroforma arctica JP610]|uniref:Seipin n=1 Tax=Sphaeroforma arctica JP610 TaxID=667725 RepID=A0A0L0FHS1_9EUKA|nr:hypothetical protein SARC_11188 [Sphaeroforma arctica JP610]KNC76305.1 hypothetical protein SARC_11188 [Sphaeroforma arctica JP610]|eukprot:XP_014150207.1 hypothetical protein SARC_11188 [Sphaeroforma arctica JP610]